MNSLKNLMVIVLLMGVSYGAFQVINTPDPARRSGEAEEMPLDLGAGALHAEDDILDKPFPNMSGVEFGMTRNSSPRDDREAPESGISVPNAPSSSVRSSADSRLPSLPPGIGGLPHKDPEAFAKVPELNPASPPAGVAANPEPPPAEPGVTSGNQPSGNLVASSNLAGAIQAPALIPPSQNLEPVIPKPDFSSNASPFSEAGKALAEPSAALAMTDPRTSAPTNLLPGIPQADAGLPSNTSSPAEIANTLPPTIHETLPTSPTSAANPAPAPPAAPIDWASIANKASAGNPRDALSELSAHYADSLPADQRMQMLEWLDLLAGKVIYSTEHHLQPRPYIVAAGETLESIAARWNVPPQLIYNVHRNKIGGTPVLTPGIELKVIPGPFNAQISLDRMEMTLFLGDLYAGRFPIEMGQDAVVEHGSFMVESRSEAGRDYVAAGTTPIPAGTAGNPYGKYWIGLGEGNPCIHESATMGSGKDFSGCIRMASSDAQDVFGILSVGSQISIQR